MRQVCPTACGRAWNRGARLAAWTDTWRAIVKASGYDRDWLMWGGPLVTPEDPHPGGTEVTVRYETYPLELARAA